MVLFERHDEAMRRRPGQSGRLLQLGQIERSLAQCLQQQRRLVDHADAAYTVHIQECYPIF